MNVFHVQVVGRDGVGNGVLSQDLRLFYGIRCHELRIEIDRVVAQFGLRDRFQTLTTLGQVRISLYPSVIVSFPSRFPSISANLKQSMCMVCLDLYSCSLSGLNPISSYMLIPCILALMSTNGKSKLSPLYVAMTVGLQSRMCSNHLRIRAGYGSVANPAWSYLDPPRPPR